MSSSSPEISIHSIDPYELIKNPALLNALVLSYLGVFNQRADNNNESEFKDKYTFDEVKERILSDTDASNPANDHQTHLIIATVPWNETIHSSENFYSAVTDAAIAEAPFAVIGCLYSKGQSTKQDVQESVVSTATKFKDRESSDQISEKVKLAFEKLDETSFDKLLYVPEAWVRKNYRGYTGLRMMKKLGDLLMVDHHLVKDQILFWTIKKSPMYGLAQKHLKAKDILALDKSEVLMIGDSQTIYDKLNKGNKYENFIWGHRAIQKLLCWLRESWGKWR